MKPGRLSHLLSMITALAALPLQSSGSIALAEGPAEGKGPEVSTVGADSYLGPLPEELAKREFVEAVGATAPSAVKVPAAETVTSGEGNAPTSEALAKLAMLLDRPLPTPLLDMEKLASLARPTTQSSGPKTATETTKSADPTNSTHSTTPKADARSAR
jgi:hypothetical protein